MGAHHSAACGPVHLLVVMPSKGNKVLKSKFIKDAQTSGLSIREFFQKSVSPLLQYTPDAPSLQGNVSCCGELLRVAVVTKADGTDEIDVDDLSDEANMYVQMGLKKVVFYVEQTASTELPAKAQHDFAAQFVRESHREVPFWTHAGRPALSKLHGELRELLRNEKLGFRGAADLKTGGEWLLELVNVLYRLSPYHDKLKARGHPVPKRFAFSSGADDYKKKGKAVPLLKEEYLERETLCVQRLLLYPHLDDDEWCGWRDDMISLQKNLEEARKGMVKHAAKVALNTKTSSSQQRLSSNEFGTVAAMRPGAADFREAVSAVALKYIELNRTLQAFSLYHPLSLTLFEPANAAERYVWLQNLKLSYPVALIKVAVGGSLGVLVWVVKRDPDLLELAGDEEEIEDAKKLIQPVVPQIHGRAQRKFFESKIRDITSLSKSVARHVYKEMTGDESSEVNSTAHARQAAVDEAFAMAETFALACGDAEILGDLRHINNAARRGTTGFKEFWNCVQQELDSMSLAAEERRHSGVVVYLSEVISHQQLFNRAEIRFKAKIERGEIDDDSGTKLPSLRWFIFQFWPSNEHVHTALQYTCRFPLKLQLQVRNLRKEHAHSYYCAKQKKLTEAWVHRFREYCTAGQPDDKANGTIGEPGTATAFLTRQRSALAPTATADMRAIDHDAGSSKMRVIPSVFLKQEIPEEVDGSWLRGQVYVTLKNNLFEASEANKSLAELQQCLRDCKPNVWLHADGGGEHHVGHPSVIAATISLFRRLHNRVDRLIKTRGCPYHSYLHEVERVMSILNLGLYGVAMERPLIREASFPGMEHLFQTCKTTSAIRAAGKRYPKLVEGLDDAMQPLYGMLYERFEQLELMGTPFTRGEKVTAEEADQFFDEIRAFLPESVNAKVQRGCFKRKHLDSPLLKEFMDIHCICDPYKIEVFKGCWQSQLRALKAKNNGSFPVEEVEELFRNFKCKFGCPPPVTPVEVFVEMHEVPRPKQTGINKYDSFDDTFGTPTPVNLPPLKPGAQQESAPAGVLEKDKVRSTIRCIVCRKLRCVYVKAKLSSSTMGAPDGCTLQDVLLEALEVNRTTYSCGSELDLNDFPSLRGPCRPHVRLKLDCSMHLELQLFSSKILPEAEASQICGFCGEDATPHVANDETSPLLPVCQPCLEQHQKARQCGKQAPRFDRSGQRERAAQAAQVRRGQVEQIRERERNRLNAAPADGAANATTNVAITATTATVVDATNATMFTATAGTAMNATTNTSAAGATRKRSRRHVDDSSDDADANATSEEEGNAEEDDERVDESSGSHDDGEDDEQFYVNVIHRVRYHQGHLEFLIEWHRYPDEHDFTWEPIKHLPNDKEKIAAFKADWLAAGKPWPTRI